MFVGTVCDTQRGGGRLRLGLVLACVLGGSAIAEDRYYVMRDGRKVPLLKSNTELGLVFRPHAEVEAGRRRLEAAGHGIVEDINGAPRARVKILRVRDTGAIRRSLLRQDPAVQEIGDVYRFAGSGSPVISTGMTVVKLRGDLSNEQREELWREYQLVNVEAFKGLHDVYTATVVGENADEVLLAERLADDGRTLWAHTNFRRVRRRRQVAPSDEFFDEQWHLENTGQSVDGTEDADIDALEAWAIADGTDVLFGMFDDACDVDHEDLKDNYIGVGHDPSLSSEDEGFEDPRPKQEGDSHGTAVMGLAVAAANSTGVRGVAFEGQFTASRGLLDEVTDVDIASAYTFALEQGVDVHINSWGLVTLFGSAPNPPVIEDAIETAFNEGRDPDGPGGADPLGMVIVFASGNEGAENEPGFELSTLPQVIGVGSSNVRDGRSSYSNFGPELNFLAPGDSFIATTDNEDGEDKVEEGYNVAGLNEHPLFEGHLLGPEIDPTGRYTGNFAGTSAACPIAAGVAGLILSVNQQLTATDVRLIMEHTCDKISPVDAWYNEITNRSLAYGYGRVNAHRAVVAAQESLTNGGRAWPDIPTNVTVVDLEPAGTALLWRAGVGTDEFLVVESNDDFSFIPEDGVCYDTLQLDCESSTPQPLPSGVSLLFVGCSGDCGPGSGQSVEFDLSAEARKFFAIYGRSSIGRYSFGVAVDSEGGEDVGSGGDGAGTTRGPAVTITASPREGLAPLTVQFNGNALSELEIDKSRTTWDFDVFNILNDDETDDATTTSATFTYPEGIVPAGETWTFTARLTMYDVAGNEGWAEVRIRVTGAAGEDGGMVGNSDVRIIVGVPGTAGSDVSEGISPFTVELRVDTGAVAGTLQSVVWDLGDGRRAAGLAVPHTYVNEGSTSLVIPITATLETMSSGGTTLTTTATRLITVHPGTAVVDVGEPNLPGTETLGEGGAASPCGAIGMVPLFFGMASLMLLRRKSC